MHPLLDRRGVEPSRRIAESDRSIALLDINPVTDGHTLVLPRAHTPDIWSLDEEDAADIWRLAIRVARRLRDVLHPEGMTLFQANGAAGWQDVLHFHLHVVPRWGGDPLIRPWHLTPGDPRRLDAIAASLRR